MDLVLDAKWRQIKIDMRALLQSAGLQGLTLEDIERDYMDLFNRPIPYEELGVENTHELLLNMPDVVNTLPAIGTRPTMYYPLPNASTCHLESLIDRQRVHAPTRFGGIVPNVETNDGRATTENSRRPTSVAAQSLPRPPNIALRKPTGCVDIVRVPPSTQPSNQRASLRQQLKERLREYERLAECENLSSNRPQINAQQDRGIMPVPKVAPGPNAEQQQQQRTSGRVFDPNRDVTREDAMELLQRLREMNSQREGGGVANQRQNSVASQQSGSSISQDAGNGRPPTFLPCERSAFVPWQAGDFQQQTQNSRPLSGLVPDVNKNFSTSWRSSASTSSELDFAASMIPARRATELTPNCGGAQAHLAPSPVDSELAAIGGTSSRQRHDSGTISIADSSITMTDYEFPEEAPQILQSQLPAGVKVPHSLWEITYSILRAYDNGREWLDIRQFQTEYARRTKKPLSTDYLKKTCGIGSYKQLFVVLPNVDVMHSPDDTMYVRLLAPSISNTKKNCAMFDVKPRFKSVRPATHGGVAPTLDDEQQFTDDQEEKLLIPLAPSASAHFRRGQDPARAIPQDLRSQIYHLLWNHFRHGVDISTFSENFTKRYGASLNTQRDCKMSLVVTLHYMGDIVDVGKAEDGKYWLRPVDYEKVLLLYRDQKRASKERRARGIPTAAKVVDEEEDDDDDDYLAR